MNFTYDKQRLIEWMTDFYSLTNIKTAIYDNDFAYILGFPERDSAFCTSVKENPLGLKNCDKCTKNAIEEVRKKNSLYIYTCHAGLTEAVAPIRINGVIVGYMMLGQIFEKHNKDYAMNKILSAAENYAISQATEYIGLLTTKSYSEIKAASKIMESCVCYLLMNQVIKENDGGIAFKLNDYIEENIGNHLTVGDLCKRFNISRNALYKISKTYFGMPMAQYVNQKRIEKATKLIKDGVSVTDVADITGFCDYGYFGKTFKKMTGITPTQLKAD